MRKVSVRELRQNLGEVLRAAESGETTVVTRRGKPVARITAARPGKAKPLPDQTEFRKSIPYDGGSIVESLMEERRKARA